MKLLILFSLILVTGCSTVGHLTTPSGKPEVTVKVSSDIKPIIANWLSQHGYQITNQTDYSIVGERETPSEERSLSLGMERESFSISSNNNATTIYGMRYYFDHIGGQLHEKPATNQSQYEAVQSDLQEIASQIK